MEAEKCYYKMFKNREDVLFPCDDFISRQDNILSRHGEKKSWRETCLDKITPCPKEYRVVWTT